MNARSIHQPEPLQQDFERYLVNDRLEIVSILRKLQSRREQISLNWELSGFALTMLLAVNPDFEEMVLDCGSDSAANHALLHAERITVVAMIDGIKVQFSGRHPDATVYEGYPALRMRLPDLVLRLQRRDYFRVPANLTSTIALENDGAVRVLEWRVADMSLGGVALLTDKTFVRIERGQILENCSISLGGLGALSLSLEVQNTAETIMRNGNRQMRLGCRFLQLQHGMEKLISNYIGQAERERRSRT